MSGFYRSLEYVVAKMNQARDTKQSIITAANSSEYIMKKIKEIEEIAWVEVQEEKVENLHFNPNEVEPRKDREEEER